MKTVQFTAMEVASARQGLAKRRFSADEDKAIMALVEQYGPHAWSDIASHMTKRTPRQCRERYRHYLQPGIENPAWTPEDDLILTREFERLGPKWSTIREYLPGRTDVAIKNRWALITRRPPPHPANGKKSSASIPPEHRHDPNPQPMEAKQSQSFGKTYHVADANPLADAWSLVMIEDWQMDYCNWTNDRNKE
jgi:hypothetical protein